MKLPLLSDMYCTSIIFLYLKREIGQGWLNPKDFLQLNLSVPRGHHTNSRSPALPQTSPLSLHQQLAHFSNGAHCLTFKSTRVSEETEGSEQGTVKKYTPSAGSILNPYLYYKSCTSYTSCHYMCSKDCSPLPRRMYYTGQFSCWKGCKPAAFIQRVPKEDWFSFTDSQGAQPHRNTALKGDAKRQLPVKGPLLSHAGTTVLSAHKVRTTEH